MNKILKVILIILSLLLISFAIFFLVKKIGPKKAGIFIETSPTSTVYINNQLVGKTPYSGTMEAKEIDLKLVPDPTDTPLVFFETRIPLSAGIQTVVKREFAETEEDSKGEIISFEKTGENGPSIAVISDPDSSQVTIDGKAYGFTPYKTSQITSSSHQIAVGKDGFIERTITVKTILGYKLTLITKLGKDKTKVEVTPLPSATPIPQVKIEILPTPNGFLRVREEGSTSSKEVAKVNPKDTFTLIEESEDKGWYKIEYETGKFGWISSQYVKKL